MSELKNTIAKFEKLQKFANTKVHDIIGTEAVNFYKESFQKLGFTNGTLKKWDDVKRRDSTSSWYGFKYGSTAKRPGKEKRKKDSITNFSTAATKRPILSGETQELMSAFKYSRIGRIVRIYNTKAYAKIINEGGKLNVFGKGGGTMPARQFMGPSKTLQTRIEKKIAMEIKKLLK